MIGHVFVQLFTGPVNTIGLEEMEGASPSTRYSKFRIHISRPDTHMHPQSVQAPEHLPNTQADRSFSCRPPSPPEGSLIRQKSTENKLTGEVVMFVGSIFVFVG